MSQVRTARHWSTLTLSCVGVALGLSGYVAGWHSHRRSPPLSLPRTSLPTVAVTRPVGPLSPPPLVLTVAAPDNPEARWREFASAAGQPSREKEMLALLTELGASDPLRALALAAAEPNWRLSSLLCNAVLHGWASKAPTDAAQFALALPESERNAAIAAVLQGAANQPETAAGLAATLCAQDPAHAGEHGRALIEALAGVGAFDTLARFAASDTSEHSSDWLNSAFYQWAGRDPSEARRAVEALATPEARQAAFQGMVLGWSMANPRDLADYASVLPEGENRSLALRQALAQWIAYDPQGVAEWGMRTDIGPDFDQSAATVATRPALALAQPDVALNWAQSITEPTLRESTLAVLARQWSQQRVEKARILITSAPGLSESERLALVTGWNSADANGP